MDLAATPSSSAAARTIQTASGTSRWKGRDWRKDGKILFADNDAKQWAAWGIDYLKYDWNPRSTPGKVSNDVFEKQVADMAKALENSGRDIVYSYSNCMPFDAIPQVSQYLNAWRTTGDIRDSWWSLTQHRLQQDKWAEYAKPGHWNDPDMLVVGHVGWSKNLHPTKLTPDEQYTAHQPVVAALLAAADRLPDRADGRVHAEPSDQRRSARRQPGPAGQAGPARVAARRRSHATKTSAPAATRRRETTRAGRSGRRSWRTARRAVGLFNLGNEEMTVVADFKELKLDGKQIVRDLWRQKDIATVDGKFEAKVAPHGVVFVKLSPAK